jgi:hypothetical protein
MPLMNLKITRAKVKRPKDPYTHDLIFFYYKGMHVVLLYFLKNKKIKIPLSILNFFTGKIIR